MLIDEDLDTALTQLARPEGTSKAELIRRFVRQQLEPLPPPEADPIWQSAGVDEYEPEPIDDVVYP